MADLIAGDANFSGKLPFTYPKFINSLATYDYKPCEQMGTSGRGSIIMMRLWIFNGPLDMD